MVLIEVFKTVTGLPISPAKNNWKIPESLVQITSGKSGLTIGTLFELVPLRADAFFFITYLAMDFLGLYIKEGDVRQDIINFSQTTSNNETDLLFRHDIRLSPPF